MAAQKTPLIQRCRWWAPAQWTCSCERVCSPQSALPRATSCPARQFGRLPALTTLLAVVARRLAADNAAVHWRGRTGTEPSKARISRRVGAKSMSMTSKPGGSGPTTASTASKEAPCPTHGRFHLPGWNEEKVVALRAGPAERPSWTRFREKRIKHEELTREDAFGRPRPQIACFIFTRTGGLSGWAS